MSHIYLSNSEMQIYIKNLPDILKYKDIEDDDILRSKEYELTDNDITEDLSDDLLENSSNDLLENSSNDLSEDLLEDSSNDDSNDVSSNEEIVDGDYLLKKEEIVEIVDKEVAKKEIVEKEAAKEEIVDKEVAKEINFNNFLELPLELQEKILCLEPIHSCSLNKSFQMNQILTSNYYDNVCLKSSVRDKELVNYFNSLEPGDIKEFSYFMIGIDSLGDITVIDEKYQILKLKDGRFMILERHSEDRHEYIFNAEDVAIDIFHGHGDIGDVYLFLPSIDILTHILKSRQSNKNYVNDYLRLLVKEFLDFFVYFPGIIAKFSVNYLNIFFADLKQYNIGEYPMFIDQDSLNKSKQNNKIITRLFDITLKN
jgi:hypothetical protein